MEMLNLMNKRDSTVSNVFLIFLCISSLLYYNLDNSLNQSISNFTTVEPTSISLDNFDSIDEPDKIELPVIRKVDTPGEYKTQGYFHHYQTVNLDFDGDVWEFQPYEEMREDGDLCDYEQHRFQSDMPDTMPPQADVMYTMWENSIDIKSAFFTPVFEHETTIDGNVWIIANIRNEWTANQPSVRYRIRAFLHNETSHSNTFVYQHYWREYDPNEHYWYGDRLIGKDITSFTLSSPIVVPAGFRIKYQFQARLNRLDCEGHFRVYTNNDDSSENVGEWVINDGIYSKTYSIIGLEDDINFGASFYMFSEKYPEISATGFSNNSYYINQNKNISIDVTDSVNSSYRWDGGSYIPFNDSTWTMSPSAHGWHILEVKASDEYNNTRTQFYQIGYDSSLKNIILDNPTNGSLISENTNLYFSNYSIDYAMHEWDKNGTLLNTTECEYILPVPNTAGYHNLTVTSYDEFTTKDFFYVFTIDNSTALVTLISVENDTTYPAGKVVDIEITDDSDVDVQYKWDAQDKLPWSPFSGNIYRTYLPGVDAPHFLYVYTNDSFGHYSEKMYKFTTDNTVLGVELQNMINNSYYYGGNEVNLTITGSNDTVYYRWDGGSEKEIELTEAYLLLSGSDALPDTWGIHNLTIRTFDISDVEEIFTFSFKIDKEVPTIDPSIYDYHNERFRNSDSFTFLLSDNNISSTELTVYYSIDGGDNITIIHPFNLALTYLNDGVYNLTLYVYDIANNLAKASFIFIMDTTPPELTLIDISDLKYVLGVYYVPANTSVVVTITDDDLSVQSTFSWGGTLYTPFVNSFSLDYISGTSILYINASDSLGNHALLYSIELTIDNVAPAVTIMFPANNSKINYNTTLDFNVGDFNFYTIKEVEYSWDIFYPARDSIDFDSSGDFEMYLNQYYEEGFALLYVFTEDVVGNTKTYIFNFEVDLTAPISAFYVGPQNISISNYENEYLSNYVYGNTSIWYNTSENSDLGSILYYWNNNTESEQRLNMTNPVIWIPTTDGLYNLTITLEDDTEGYYSNKINITYFFYVDDIHIDVVFPENLEEITHQLVYGDSLIFRIKIYDIYDNSSISELFWNQTILNYSNLLNLNIINNTIDNKTFQFSIFATNVGDTSLIFEFSKTDSSKHQVVVNLSIAKKEGQILILEDSILSTIYEDDITINVFLRDEFGTNQSISAIYANGTEITNFIHLGDYVCQFNYSSYNTFGKGAYILEIRVESDFYFGQTNSSYILEFNILPIPLVLEIFVSNYNVTYGNNVIISGLLTFTNGTPIEDIDITFYIYIYYKNKTRGVYAFISGYDDFEVLMGNTNSTGHATITFQVTEDIEYIAISASYGGSPFLGDISFEFEDIIRAIKPPGLPSSILYGIIAGAIFLVAIISFIIYKLTRPKPFEQLMEEVEEAEIIAQMIDLNPGVILNIFDQQKGAIPLVGEHNLDGIYRQKLVIGVDNFLLKTADQAYSSLGFEEQHDRRRIGSILLPNEGMVGFIHGIQLPNPAARGGFENLTLVVLANEQYDTHLFGNQIFLYDDIDELISMLNEKKSLEEIREQLVEIRKKATRIIIAAVNAES